MFFNHKRKKLLEQLKKIDYVDNPNQYKQKYKELYQLYKKEKIGKYNEEEILDKLDMRLSNNGLKTFREIIDLEQKQELRLEQLEADFQEVDNDLLKLEDKIEDLQSLKENMEIINIKLKFLDGFILAGQRKKNKTVVSKHKQPVKQN